MPETKEYMQTIPEIIENPEEPYRYVCEDDVIFHISIGELLRVLENDSRFYENPTPETMTSILNEYLKESIKTLKEDYQWYIEKVMPVFLKDEFKEV